MCKLRWHCCYKAIIQLSLLNNGAPLGYLSINIQVFLTQLGYHWNQSLDLKHASIALKEMGPRTFSLLIWVSRYNNFSREINEMQISDVTCVWRDFEKLNFCVVPMLLSILRRSERFILFTCSKKRAKIKLVAIICMTTSTFWKKEFYFKAEAELPSPQCPRHYQQDGHLILGWPLVLCTANEKSEGF